MRDKARERAPESAKFQDLDRKSATHLLRLVEFWVGEARWDDALVGVFVAGTG